MLIWMAMTSRWSALDQRLTAWICRGCAKGSSPVRLQTSAKRSSSSSVAPFATVRLTSALRSSDQSVIAAEGAVVNAVCGVTGISCRFGMAWPSSGSS
jgi:hypothetical protein